MKKHHIIYVPGLGDKWDLLRRRALSLWKIFNVSTELVPMKWYSDGTYEQRVDKVSKAIAAAQARGQSVTLIGESAGGSIATNIFTYDNRISHLMTLCGVVHPEAMISPAIYAQGPAFRTSMDKLAESVSLLRRKNNLTVITAFYDPIVSHKHNVIDEARHVRLPSVGHFITILLGLTLYSPYIIYLVKNHK